MASNQAAGQPHVKERSADTVGPLASSAAKAEPNSPISEDLPKELVEAGWRRFWSKRENRYYYFNKFTNQALWELPTVVGGPVVQAVDAAESCSPFSPRSVTSPSQPGAHVDGSSTTQQRRRSHSIESRDQATVVKKTFTFTSPSWNLEIPSNAVVHERSMSCLYPPHPDIELLRTQFMIRLRQQYHEMCRSRLGIEPPLESFNRWLLERQVADEGDDPMLPTKCVHDQSSSLVSELVSSLPLGLTRPQFSGDARRQLSRYAETAQRLVETSKASPDTRKIVKWNVEEMFQWLRSHSMASYDECLERLSHLKRQCQPHIDEILKDSAESLCLKLTQLATEDASKIRTRQQDLWASLGLAATSPALCHSSRLVTCYPVLLAQPGPRLPSPDVGVEGEYTTVKYKGDILRLSTPYYYKLEQLYRWNCKDDPRMDNFAARVWCLLRRYQTFFGINKFEGMAMQMSLPVPVFECLNRVFGVTFEWFASPLNCYYKQFCSAFGDTDGYFGSRGTFLEFCPISGSFEANPPYCSQIIDAMADHFEDLLSASQEPLSIVVFLPEVADGELPSSGAGKLSSSRFNRKHVLLSASDHTFVHGFQHICSRDQLNVLPRHSTLLTVLQNDLGYDRWPPSEEKVRELVASFAPRTYTA